MLNSIICALLLYSNTYIPFTDFSYQNEYYRAAFEVSYYNPSFHIELDFDTHGGLYMDEEKQSFVVEPYSLFVHGLATTDSKWYWVELRSWQPGIFDGGTINVSKK